jgi:hypothetical protein
MDREETTEAPTKPETVPIEKINTISRECYRLGYRDALTDIITVVLFSVGVKLALDLLAGRVAD